ncbi:MAG: heterodisulfide reductase-related iron-sulfur binding cluster [Chloroflexi bacterium]|nr:heterodisulfide reductase-related iron-sulfur binding cluster [Chloroflexota bacterium]
MVSAPDRHSDAGQHMGGGIDAGHGFPYGLPFEGSLNDGPGFAGSDAPAEADLYRCVHCGLCLSACPTYVETRLETESPRGRIALMKAVHEGRTGISDRLVSHWELCLQCRACEAVCPSGVPYGRLMEHTRAQVQDNGLQSPELGRLSRLFLKAALPHNRRLRLAGHLMRLYQRSGVQGLVRKSRLLGLMPGDLAAMEAQMPVMGRQFFEPGSQVFPARGEKQMTVGLLSGCVMPLMQGDAMRAAVRVLQRNGCDVAVPAGQGCCGALNLHAGDLELGRQLAKRNIDAFKQAGVDVVVTASAGCGSSMKEYGDLLRDDPEYAEAAHEFARNTRDITEFLAGLPLDPPSAQLPWRVTMQDPCHLAHAQRITEAPRQVLRSIPGLELVEMAESSLCCGSAGFYSLIQRDMSRRLQRRKIGNATATGAEVIASANPGCISQLEQGLQNAGAEAQVMHVVEILDAAYQAEG